MIISELFNIKNLLLLILSSIGSKYLLKNITINLNNINLLILIIVHILILNYLEINLGYKCNEKSINKYNISALSINIILIIYVFIIILLIYVWIEFISKLSIINPFIEYIPILYFLLIKIFYYIIINKLIFDFKC